MALGTLVGNRVPTAHTQEEKITASWMSGGRLAPPDQGQLSITYYCYTRIHQTQRHTIKAHFVVLFNAMVKIYARKKEI